MGNIVPTLIADDHELVLEGIRHILAPAPDFELVGEARDGWETLERLRSTRPRLLLMDLSLPGPHGVDLLKRIRAEFPPVRILAFSLNNESQTAARALRAGAAGYLSKDCKPAELLLAARKVAAGEHYLDPELAGRLVFEALLSEERQPHELLSDKEYEIFLRVAGGAALNDIAGELKVSSKTVSTHKARVMQKLGLSSNADLVRYALKRGLVN